MSAVSQGRYERRPGVCPLCAVDGLRLTDGLRRSCHDHAKPPRCHEGWVRMNDPPEKLSLSSALAERADSVHRFVIRGLLNGLTALVGEAGVPEREEWDGEKEVWR